jgi:hypothetical protein
MKTDGITILVCLFGIIVCTYLIAFTELTRREDRAKVNCDVLMGGWHPDTAKKYAELCLQAREMARQQSR